MLVLSRRANESIVIDGSIRVTVLGIRGNQVRLGIEAPGHIGIIREELCLADAAAESGHGSPLPPLSMRLPVGQDR